MSSHHHEKADYSSSGAIPLISRNSGSLAEYRTVQDDNKSGPGISSQPRSQGGYPPSQGGYPSGQGGYPSEQGGYPSGQGGYPPVQEGYPSSQGGYPPSQEGYPNFQNNQTPKLPITSQPKGDAAAPNSGEMGTPHINTHCPQGLEYLTTVDRLGVNRQPNLKETVVGWVSKNKYIITNSVGEQVFYAEEESSNCSRNCWGSCRGFDLKVMDNFGNEVISMTRPMACQHCCCPCCLQSMEVSSPSGTAFGLVEQKWSLFYPTFHIKNENGDIVLKIGGPFCGSACCADVNFMILSTDGETELGKVYKKFLGCGNQMYTDENVFGIEFPMNLDVRMKAVMLGACFLIEMMYFEISGNMRNAPHIPVNSGLLRNN